MIGRIIILFASGFGSGYLRPAPGTWGSAAACLLLWLVGNFWQPSLLIAIVIALLLLPVGAFCAQSAGKSWGKSDDGRIVIDEWLGIWISLLALPWTPMALILGFVFFRLFDIWKPAPIGYIDTRLANGWGVMLDDVVAGVYANVSIHILLLGLDWILTP